MNLLPEWRHLLWSGLSLPSLLELLNLILLELLNLMLIRVVITLTAIKKVVFMAVVIRLATKIHN